MNNIQLINEIQEKAQPILETLSQRETREFRLDELEINEGVSYKGTPLTGKALRNVLNILRVKKNFTDLSMKMSSEDWETVSQRIKNTEGSTKLFAKMVPNAAGNMEIVDTFRHNETKKRADEGDPSTYINWIIESLGESEKTFRFKKLDFDPLKELIHLVVLDENSDTDVFGTGKDIWKLGNHYTFGSMEFKHAPFFERLICSNGNTSLQHGFGSHIEQSRFNDYKIQNVIKKSLLEEDSMNGLLKQATDHLQKNEISLAEFYEYRNFFNRRNSEGIYDSLIHKYFDDSHFFKAYGVNIEEKSHKWKSTANTGINAYDFFNLLTYVASHPEKVRVDSNHRLDLQISASNLLFKKQLDLEDVAQTVKIAYPRLAEMN